MIESLNLLTADEARVQSYELASSLQRKTLEIAYAIYDAIISKEMSCLINGYIPLTLVHSLENVGYVVVKGPGKGTTCVDFTIPQNQTKKAQDSKMLFIPTAQSALEQSQKAMSVISAKKHLAVVYSIQLAIYKSKQSCTIPGTLPLKIVEILKEKNYQVKTGGEYLNGPDTFISFSLT